MSTTTSGESNAGVSAVAKLINERIDMEYKVSGGPKKCYYVDRDSYVQPIMLFDGTDKHHLEVIDIFGKFSGYLRSYVDDQKHKHFMYIFPELFSMDYFAAHLSTFMYKNGVLMNCRFPTEYAEDPITFSKIMIVLGVYDHIKPIMSPLIDKYVPGIDPRLLDCANVNARPIIIPLPDRVKIFNQIMIKHHHSKEASSNADSDEIDIIKYDDSMLVKMNESREYMRETGECGYEEEIYFNAVEHLIRLFR